MGSIHIGIYLLDEPVNTIPQCPKSRFQASPSPPIYGISIRLPWVIKVSVRQAVVLDRYTCQLWYWRWSFLWSSGPCRSTPTPINFTRRLSYSIDWLKWIWCQCIWESMQNIKMSLGSEIQIHFQHRFLVSRTGPLRELSCTFGVHIDILEAAETVFDVFELAARSMGRQIQPTLIDDFLAPLDDSRLL
jgi:hypothetical protein